MSTLFSKKIGNSYVMHFSKKDSFKKQRNNKFYPRKRKKKKDGNQHILHHVDTCVESNRALNTQCDTSFYNLSGIIVSKDLSRRTTVVTHTPLYLDTGTTTPAPTTTDSQHNTTDKYLQSY